MRPRRVLLGLPAALRVPSARIPALAMAMALVVGAAPVAGAAAIARDEPGPRMPPAPPAAHLPPPFGITTLVSERVGGGFPSGPSAEASISANGRFVAFTSAAADLVTGDTNEAIDVFVRDTVTGQTVRAPLPGGAPVPPGGRAYQPSISGDGNVVAFVYEPPFTTGTIAAPVLGPRILAWDRRANAVELVSRYPNGTIANASTRPSVSGNGRYVAYETANEGLVREDFNGSPDVFRFDRQTAQTVPVSLAAGDKGMPAGGGDPSISADGRFVAFTSDANDALVPFSPGPGNQVFVKDLVTGAIDWVSGPTGSGIPDNEAGAPSISADGRYVAFTSLATNLVPGDQNQASDVFRRDRQTGQTIRVSLLPDDSPPGGPSGQPSISGDGRVVAFVVGSSQRGDRSSDVYARDLDANEGVLISVTTSGGSGGFQSIGPAVNGNGRFFAFASDHPGMVDLDDNKVLDVFLRDLPPVPELSPPAVDFASVALGDTSPPAAVTLGNAGWTPLTANGSTIAGPDAAQFSVFFDGCASTVLRRGQACTVTVLFAPTAEGTKAAVLQVADDFTGSPRLARLTGAGSEAVLTIEPTIGPPGIVVMAEGAGFPPDTDLVLRWSQGITPVMGPVRTDASGAFRVQVLVFHKDRTGPRDLIAESADGRVAPVTARMFVSTPTMVAPGLLLRRLLGLPITFLTRG